MVFVVCYSGCFCYIERMLACFSIHLVISWASLGKTPIFHIIRCEPSFLPFLLSFSLSSPFRPLSLKPREEHFLTTFFYTLSLTLGSYTLALAKPAPILRHIFYLNDLLWGLETSENMFESMYCCGKDNDMLIVNFIIVITFFVATYNFLSFFLHII